MNALPILAAAVSTLPEHTVDRATTVAGLTRLFPDESPDFLAQLVERSGIAERHLVRSVEETLTPVDFTARNRRYQTEAVELGERAARLALERAGLAAADVDAVIDVSCTGLMIPALDVALAPRLGLRPDVLRVPVAESGCSAGALGLALASGLAREGKTVLVLAVELSSLTLCTDDQSRTNLIAATLFGDGAGAAVVRPGDAGVRGPRLVASGSHLIPESREAMGFDIGTHGLKIVLQRELPTLVRRHLRPVVDAFLAQHDRTHEDVALHLFHPGGRRILEAYEKLFALAPDDLRYSRTSLARYGNLSSASILTVLELALEDGARVPDGKLALVIGVGPGISLELSLLDWNPA